MNGLHLAAVAGTATFLTVWLSGTSSMAGAAQKTVGNISVPPGVSMRSYSYAEPNYLKGNCSVRITAVPESRMPVIQYVWIENMPEGLQSAVERLKAAPTVLFDDVSEADAKRMVENLKRLGCGAEFTTTSGPRATDVLADGAASASQTNAPPPFSGDPIAALVRQLNATHGLWINGPSPIIRLPADAKPDAVLAQAVKMIGFDQGHIKTFTIQEIRQVQLNTGNTETYSAALLQTDLGPKILLFKPENNNNWWTRFYDVPKDVHR